MTYDIDVCEYNKEAEIGQCPRCKSNAYDEIKPRWVKWTTCKWVNGR